MRTSISQANLRMTPEEREALARCAKALGLTNAAFIRRCVEMACCSMGIPFPSEIRRHYSPASGRRADASAS